MPHNSFAAVWDIDGTICNSAPGIYKGIEYVIKKDGMRPLTPKELRSCIGPPMPASFIRLWDIDEQTSYRLVDDFREYYNVTGVFENSVYPGIIRTLRQFKRLGIHNHVCSSKPDEMVEKLLKHFEIADLFDIVSAPNKESTVSEKAALLKTVLEKSGDTAIMIGDRYFDVDAAKANGIPCVGALWGYGSKREFLSCGADFIAQNAKQASDYILKYFNIAQENVL